MGLVEGGRRGQMVKVRVKEEVLQRHKPVPPLLPSPLLTFHGLLSLIGNETIRLAHAYVDSGLLYVRTTVLPKLSKEVKVGRTGEAATDSMRI